MTGRTRHTVRQSGAIHMSCVRTYRAVCSAGFAAQTHGWSNGSIIRSAMTAQTDTCSRQVTVDTGNLHLTTIKVGTMTGLTGDRPALAHYITVEIGGRSVHPCNRM